MLLMDQSLVKAAIEKTRKTPGKRKILSKEKKIRIRKTMVP